MKYLNLNYLKRPSVYSILSYSFFTFACIFLSVVYNPSSEILSFIPLLPWYLIATAVPDLLIVFIAGYSLIFLVNTLIIYFVASRFEKEKKPIYLGRLLAAGYLLWAITIVIYATTCTEKLCEIVGLFATAPGFFVLAYIGQVEGDFAMWLSLLLSAFLFYIVGLGIEKYSFRNKKR